MNKPTIKDFNIEWLQVDGKPYIQVIRNSNIMQVMGDKLFDKYDTWSRGQMCVKMPDGEYADYPADVEAFLHGQAPLD